MSWSIVQIQISIDGAAPITCDNPGQSGGDCGSIEYGNSDAVWSVGDGVTLVESGSDFCAYGCDIEYTIIDAREGMIIDSLKFLRLLLIDLNPVNPYRQIKS